jgi:hypothetical protein
MSINIKSLVDRSLQKHSSNSFRPEDSHRRAKGAFWSHFFSSGDVPPALIDAAAAARFSGFLEVLDWWETPGFPEWFGNGEEFRQKVEYVSYLGLDVLQEVLSDRNARAADRLSAARMALEIASKFPKSNQKEQFADEKISEMDKKQLEEFIASKLKVLNNVEPE